MNKNRVVVECREKLFERYVLAIQKSACSLATCALFQGELECLLERRRENACFLANLEHVA